MTERVTRIDVGSLRLDLESRQLCVAERTVELTRVEFELLAALARRRGTAVQRAWLAEKVLDPEREGTERTLDVHISRLRGKIDKDFDKALLHTVRGAGYVLRAPDTAAPAPP